MGCEKRDEGCENGKKGEKGRGVVVLKLRTPPAFWRALKQLSEEVEGQRGSEEDQAAVK